MVDAAADLKAFGFDARESNEKPATNTTQLRMYVHTNCPFAERARLAFAARKIPFQWCEMDLQKKADWHMNANGGMVPLLETQDGTLIPESGVLMYFAHDYTKGKEEGHNLIPEDAVAAAKMRLAQEDFNKVLNTTGFWPAFGHKSWYDDEANATLASNLDKFEDFAKKYTDGKSFLSGTDSASMLDIHCFPFFARLVHTNVECLKENVHEKHGFADKLAVVHQYVDFFMNHKDFAGFTMNAEAYNRHYIRAKTWPEGQKCQLSHDITRDLGIWN